MLHTVDAGRSLGDGESHLAQQEEVESSANSWEHLRGKNETWTWKLKRHQKTSLMSLVQYLKQNMRHFIYSNR